MGFLDESAIILDAAVGIGVLEYAGKHVGSKLCFIVFACTEHDALGDGAGRHYSQRLWEDGFIYKYHIGSVLLLLARSQGMHHGDRFGCRSCFVQQGAVCQGHAGKVGHGGLEVHQRLQTSL